MAFHLAIHPEFRKCIILLVFAVSTTNSFGSSDIDSIASSLRDAINITERRVLWAKGTGALHKDNELSSTEEITGTMPRWKQDMLKNKTKGAWQKWLANDQAGVTKKTVTRSSGDVWKECGALPKMAQTFGESPTLGKLPNFYVYTDDQFGFADLLACYKEKFGVHAWEDERMWELAQNTGALWLHMTLLRHPSRVKRPEDAKLFVVPIDAYISFKAGTCGGTEHRERMEMALKKLSKSHWWNNKAGSDHVFIAPWWGAKAAWGKEIWSFASQTAVLATFDEGFAHDWKKVVVVPYVPHALLTRQGKTSCEARRDSLKSAKLGLDREISLYFRGSVMHGVNCKYGDTWVRKAAYAAMEPMTSALFTATESAAIAENGVIKLAAKDQDEDTRRVKTQENQGHYSSQKYAMELFRAEYCIHFRGDTTTSRRVYDAIAAGCVPVIISDGTHVPFTSSLNWNAFTVTIPERVLLQSSPEKVRQLFQKLIDDKDLLKAKQKALMMVRPDLLYGYGSPLDPDPAFVTKTADHLLKEALLAYNSPGKYRKFKDPKKSCVSKDSSE